MNPEICRLIDCQFLTYNAEGTACWEAYCLAEGSPVKEIENSDRCPN